MKELKVLHYDLNVYGRGQLFLIDGMVVADINADDCEWRHEYLDSILSRFDVNVVRVEYDESYRDILYNWFGF